MTLGNYSNTERFAHLDSSPRFHSHCGLAHPNDLNFKGMGPGARPSCSDLATKQKKSTFCRAALGNVSKTKTNITGT
jgi:hypothetical protein